MSLISWKTAECPVVDTYLNQLDLENATRQKSEWLDMGELSRPVEPFLQREHFSFEDCTNKAFDRDLYLYSLNDEHDEQLTSFAKSIFKDKVRSLSEDFEVIRTGVHYYPKNGFMGWHTNSDQPRWTLYITRTLKEGNSFFRYHDVKTGNIITSYDGVGYTFRIFKLGQGKTNQFKHCVYTDVDRWSLGFQIIG